MFGFRAPIALAAGMLLSACAPQTPDRFYKTGATYDDYRKDSYECERDTRMSAGSFGRGYAAEAGAQDFAIRCMMAKGWSYGRFMQGYP